MMPPPPDPDATWVRLDGADLRLLVDALDGHERAAGDLGFTREASHTRSLLVRLGAILRGLGGA